LSHRINLCRLGEALGFDEIAKNFQALNLHKWAELN
jgi:hypothetical protein